LFSFFILSFFLPKISKIVADGLYFPPIPFGVTVFEKLAVAAVKSAGAPRMFDRTPVLLGSSGYLPDIGNQAIEIAAVGASDTLAKSPNQFFLIITPVISISYESGFSFFDFLRDHQG